MVIIKKCPKTSNDYGMPNPSSSSSFSSSRKPKAKSGKNKTKSQETPTNWTDLIHVSIISSNWCSNVYL